MRLSREKINHLSHIMIKAFMQDENIEIFRDENDIRLEIVRIITEELKIEEELDQQVRKRLESYKRKLIEGSAEWEILYQKLYEEEANKKKR
ncbi:MAG: DUF507 family protein [bacterium]|nr:DUF507 family protein [bacterium]